MAKESKQYHSVIVNIILFIVLIFVLLIIWIFLYPLFCDNDWQDRPNPQQASAGLEKAEREMNKAVDEYKTVMDRLSKDEAEVVQDGDFIKVISKPGQPDANKVLMTISKEKYKTPKGIFPQQ